MAPGFTEPGATMRLLTNTIEKYIHFYKLQTYFIYTTLLVIKQIPKTQKWAGGHTVPSRYAVYIRIHNYKNLIIL